MSLNTTITFMKNDTIRVTAVLKDFDDSLLTPASDSVVIYDPYGTNMGTHTSSLVGSGTYRVDYVIPSSGTAGVWTLSWLAYSGTFPTREVINFVVAEG